MSAPTPAIPDPSPDAASRRVLLWLVAIRREGEHVGALSFLRLGVLVMSGFIVGESLFNVTLAGLIVLDLSGATPLLIHIAGFLLLVGRVVHAAGLSNSVGTSIPRALGMTMTWCAYVFLIAATLISAVL